MELKQQLLQKIENRQARVGVVGLGYVGLPLVVAFALNEEEGAATSIYLASSPEVAGVTGQYFVKKQPVRAVDYAYDEAAQQQLWAVSEALLKPVASPPAGAVFPVS